MADTHPLLMEKAEDEQEVLEQEAPESEAAPVEEPTDSPVAEEPQEEEEDEKLVLSKKNLFQEFKRLEQEDKQVANVLHDYASRSARRKLKPEMDELRAQLAEAREQLRKETIGRMSQDEIKERLANDPRFRQSYDAKVNPQLLRERATLERTVEEAFDAAVDAGMDTDTLNGFRQALTGGWYDYERDQQGNPIQGRLLAPLEAVGRLQNDIYRYMQQQQQQRVAAPQKKAAVAAAPQKPVPNRALSNAGPDLTPSGGSSAGGKSMKMSEYNRLDWKQKIAMFPSEEDVRAALANGKLVRD